MFQDTLVLKLSTSQENLLLILVAVDDEVGGAVDGDEEVGDAHHDVHLGGPVLLFPALPARAWKPGELQRDTFTFIIFVIISVLIFMFSFSVV